MTRLLLLSFEPRQTSSLGHPPFFKGRGGIFSRSRTLPRYLLRIMTRSRYKIIQDARTYFVTSTVTGWQALLNRLHLAGIVLDSLRSIHCEWRILLLDMLNRGIFSAPRGMFVISTPMTEKEVDKAVRAFETSLKLLKPYAAAVTPDLLV